MMRRRTMLRAVLAVIAIALPATADAPPTQYDRYAAADIEIKDVKTSLVWDRKRVTKQVNPTIAQTYCDATVFPANNGRVPTVKELLTLVDEDPHAEYDSTFKPPNVQKYIDRQAFSESNSPIDKPYWTSTPGFNAGEWWTVDFATGKTAIRTASEALYVRCVR
jgi:Protein of unknown function (DUF1566)